MSMYIGKDSNDQPIEVAPVIEIDKIPNGWNYINSFTLLNPSSALSSLEIDVPPNVKSLESMFTNSNLRGTNVTIHKHEGSNINNLYRAFRYSSPNRTLTFDFDTSSVISWADLFSRSGLGVAAMNVTIIGVLDFSSATNVGGMFTDWLYNANYQSSFRIAEGTLSLSWDLGNCNPDDDTLASIVAGLKDMTGGTSLTLTLNSNVKARLTQTQLDTISAKNWTLA